MELGGVAGAGLCKLLGNGGGAAVEAGGGAAVKAGGVAVEAGGEAVEKLALGIEPYLDDFARSQGAGTWKSFPDAANWQSTMLEKLADPKVKILFNLDGPVEVMPGVQRATRGMGGATDWELFQIWQNPQWWSTIEWFRNSAIVPNPFL